MRILVVFLDGVGIGTIDPDYNPFAHIKANAFGARDARIVPLDAKLGVPGLPQSGTGQTALFTGINAAEAFGRHFGPWVPTSLRQRLADENILTRAVSAGRKVAFANAYPEEILQMPNDRRLRAGPPIAALGAGVFTRHTDALQIGDALASEITNEGWRVHLQRTNLPVITPAQAGANLARIAGEHELTLFAHYSTDYVGHRGEMEEAARALQTVDDFLVGLKESLPKDVLVMVTSDHGNIEDVRTGHTLNPALGMFFGYEYNKAADGLKSLVDVAPRIYELLEIKSP